MKTRTQQWVGGRIVLPRDGGRPAGCVDMWLDPELGVVGLAIGELRKADIGGLLAEACRAPQIGTPRRPTGVRVESHALAAEIERARLGVTIEVGPTPELDALIDKLGEIAAASAEEQGVAAPMHDLVGRPWARASAADLSAAKESGARFLSARPWERIDDLEVIEVQAPSLGMSRGAALVVGQMSTHFGFLLCASLTDLRTFQRLAGQEAYRAGEALLDNDLLMFDVTPGRRGAAPEVVVMHMRRDWTPVPADAWEVRLCAAVAEAFAAFDTKRGRGNVGPVTLTLVQPAAVIPIRATDGVAAESAARQHLPGRSRWGAIADRMLPRVLRWAGDHLRGWDSHVRDVAKATSDEVRHAHALFVFPLPRSGETAAERYRAAEGHKLSAIERRWLDANIETAWTSCWSVVEADPGRSITLRDIFSEEVRTVVEASASRLVFKHDLICARVVSFDDEAYLDVPHPRSLGPREATILRRQIAPLLGLTKVKAVPVDKLQRPKIVRGLVTAWRQVVAAKDASDANLRLHNTDGDEMVMVRERFRLSRPRAEIVPKLEAMAGMFPPNRGESTWTLSKKGNAKHASWDNTTIAHVRFEGKTLVVETNSRERAAQVGGLLAAALGEALGQAERSEEDGSELKRRARRERAAKSALDAVPPLEAQAMIAEMKRKTYATWPDAPLPALGGHTARAAVKTAKGRREVATLLDNIERAEAREPPAMRFDVDVLRKALGLIA